MTTRRTDLTMRAGSPVAPLSPGGLGWRLSVVLLALVIVGGTVGYIVIEGWDLWDAFYMTIITVTTVGYREVHPLSRAGQVFTAVVIMSASRPSSTRSRS